MELPSLLLNLARLSKHAWGYDPLTQMCSFKYPMPFGWYTSSFSIHETVAIQRHLDYYIALLAPYIHVRQEYIYTISPECQFKIILSNSSFEVCKQGFAYPIEKILEIKLAALNEMLQKQEEYHNVRS